MPIVETAIIDNIGTIVLNHTEKRNALSRALIHEANEAFQKLDEAGVRAVVLRAPADVKVFSAGHDVRELPCGKDPLGYDDPLEVLIRTIRYFPAPVIGMIEGSVWGGACEVCFSCDILVCEERVSFTLTPARLGVPYNTNGLLHIRNALGSKIVRAMLFAAEAVPASRLFDVGIINRLCPREEIEEVTYSIARAIGCNSPKSIRAMKEQLRILDDAVPLSPAAFERLESLRRSVYESSDFEEGIRAFNEKRRPEFSGR